MILKRDQVYEKIRRDIVKGILKPGQKLPQGVDFARQLGVSHITFRAATARLVEDGLIDCIHGRGIFVAKNPTGVVFKTIGLVTPILRKPLTAEESPVHYSVITGIMEAAHDRKFEIRTLHRGRKSLDRTDIKTMGIDAVLVIFPFDSDARLLSGLKSSRRPLLAINLLNSEINKRYHCINIDYTSCASDSVTLMHQSGKRNIAFLTCRAFKSDSHPRGLLDGYLKQVRELGLKKNVIQVGKLAVSPTYDVSEQHIRAKAKSILRADAVVTTTYHEAIAVQKLAREHGKKVPDDLAIVGFFDRPEARKAGITTWRIPLENIGPLAVETIEKLLKAKSTKPRISLLPCELIKRRSA